MYVSPYSRNSESHLTPSSFRDSARDAIFSQLPNNNSTQLERYNSRSSTISSISNASSANSIFSSKSTNSANSFKSIEREITFESLSPIKISLDDLFRQINDNNSVVENLGYNLRPNQPFIDWELNYRRSQLFITNLPPICKKKTPEILYNQEPPLNIIVVPQYISDSNFISLLISSELYMEHTLDLKFKKQVAEVSVKKSRLLQLNSKKLNTPLNITKQPLSYENKKVALTNYILNLAAAATTQHEFKISCHEAKLNKREIHNNHKLKLTIDEKRWLWGQISLKVFERAGLNQMDG